MAAAGLARTVACTPGDNLAIHLGIAALEPGEMLVVDYGGSIESGPFGEIMALACQVRGARGLVIDGAVRDAAALRTSGLAVFCRDLAIPGTRKADRGRVGMPIRVGGVEIRPGAVIVADDDAVIALDPASLDATLERARRCEVDEARIKERLRAGETTLDALGLA